MAFYRLPLRAGIAVGAAAVFAAGLSGLAGPASATVQPRPASGTPQLYPDGGVEQVRQIVQCGGTMYAVGSFTKIQQGGGGMVYTRHNVVSFSATAPFTVSSWAPSVNGTVNTIAFNGTSCATAYLGGKFTSVNGSPAANIAAVSASTGALVAGFGHSASGQVETIASHGGHLLAGGYFTAVNGSSAHKFMASLNPATGKDDGFISLNISGNYQYCNSSGSKCAAGNGTRVYNQQISHGGSLDLVEGVFTSAGGKPRQQIFMLGLSGATAAVTGWTSPEFSQHCLSPATGNLIFNPTRARGTGADDMLVTSAGLWIASDNQNNASQCGGVFGHAGICFLPN